MKTKQEAFNEQFLEHGCGYYNVCIEHACPCNISINHSERYSERIYNELREEAMEESDY